MELAKVLPFDRLVVLMDNVLFVIFNMQNHNFKNELSFI